MSTGVLAPPDHVQLFAARFDLSVDQVRWCRRCDIVAFAIDAWQRAQLDRDGFRELCPDCTAAPRWP